MIKFFTILFIVILFFHENVVPQAKISFKKTEHDFGIVASQNFPPAAFEFENNGTAPLAILMSQGSPSVKINFPRKYIQPGEKGHVYVHHNNNQVGDFQEKIKIITNASADPVILTIKGKNVTVQECFPDPSNFNIREVIVINSITKEPVIGAG
ncbi:MAG: DUF1573 domain-containing protein, partial [Bacteroidota bacterium]